MNCFSFAGNACIFLLVFLFILQLNSFGQCITTLDSRENITTNTTQIAGSKSKSLSGNNLNVAYINQGNGAKLTLNFSGSNNTYSNDTIRFVGTMTVENISRNNNTLTGLVFVVTENSNIKFKSFDLNNGSNIRFINYGSMTFENSFTMPNSTIFINKLASSVLTFSASINFANNSNATVLYSNGGIVNFNSGFTLQSNNKVCLTGYTQLNTTSITNNVTNSIYVPTSFSACIKYTNSVNLNNTLTNGPGLLYIAQVSGASNPSNLSRWGTSIVNTNSNGCNVILPVTLKDISVTAQKNYALIKWSTVSEINSSLFYIERSVDGINFRSIGTVYAKGYSTTTTDYLFKDFNFAEPLKYYYRLKMVDRDGKFTYSGIKEIKFTDDTHSFQVMVSAGKILAHFAPLKNNTQFFISDALGQIIYRKELSAGENEISVDNHFAHGNYFVTMVSKDKKESFHIAY